MEITASSKTIHCRTSAYKLPDEDGKSKTFSINTRQSHSASPGEGEEPDVTT